MSKFINIFARTVWMNTKKINKPSQKQNPEKSICKKTLIQSNQGQHLRE
jgi:hypothetical protein